MKKPQHGVALDGEAWADHPDLLVRVSDNGRVWSSSSRKLVKPRQVYFGGKGYLWAVKIQNIWHPVVDLVHEVWGIVIDDSSLEEYDITPIPNGGRVYRNMIPVYCFETDTVYMSQTAAGKAVGLSIKRRRHFVKRTKAPSFLYAKS